MRFRWLFGNFADPQHELSRDQERELSKLAHEHHMPTWRFVAWSVLTIVAPLSIAYLLLLPFVLRVLGLTGRTGPFILGVVAIAALSWPLSAWSYGHLYVVAVRRAMRTRGIDVCLGCGYRLARLPAESERCPECGRQREEATGTIDARGEPGRGSP